MAEPTRRVVRMDRFKKQLAENVGTDELLPIEIGKDERVYIRLGFQVEDTPDFQDFMKRLQTASPGDESAMVILGEHPELSGEEQLEKWKAAGYTTDDLALVFGAETQEYKDSLGKFRYRG
ncbi:hypothetical protein ACPROK_14720 [Glutamicibacter soli]|uniref:hypothetical protein n=1 Tax=Glutamicibacter soli TaxID=453836 RepID=UPI003C7645F2